METATAEQELERVRSIDVPDGWSVSEDHNDLWGLTKFWFQYGTEYPVNPTGGGWVPSSNVDVTIEYDGNFGKYEKASKFCVHEHIAGGGRVCLETDDIEEVVELVEEKFDQLEEQVRVARVKSHVKSIKGIGTKTTQRLIEEFGSREAIEAANVEELAKIPLVTETIAHRLKGQTVPGEFTIA